METLAATALPSALSAVLSRLPRLKFAPQADLVLPGVVSASVWWIQSGLVRLYSLGVDGLARVHDFHEAGEWVCAGLQWRDGRLCCEDAALGVQALRTSVAVPVALDWLEQQRRDSAEIGDWLTQQLMQLSARRLRRETGLMQRSAEQRYLELLEERPGLVSRLAQHQIAAWLGITPVALSRIRRRLALQP